MSDPREPMDPQVKQLFDLMRAARPAQRSLEAVAMRAETAAFSALLNADAPLVEREDELRIPGPKGRPLRVRVFYPPGTGAKKPVLVFLHGGGWVILSPETHAKLTKQLCLSAGAVVVSVDYRLAPEQPYPAALDDCVAAFRWVRENAGRLGGDDRRIFLGGDSAGGNLTAATTLRLLAAAEKPPMASLMICPVTDLDQALTSASAKKFGPGDPVLDDATMRFFCESYAPRASWQNPFVSPLRGDLSKFPPTCVVVGTIDPLYDDGVAFAKKLSQAGREAVLLSYPGMPHDFMLFPGLDTGAKSIEEMAGFLRTHMQ
jgi:acetyl esterase